MIAPAGCGFPLRKNARRTRTVCVCIGDAALPATKGDSVASSTATAYAATEVVTENDAP